MRREPDRKGGAQGLGIGVVSHESFAAGAGPMIVFRPGPQGMARHEARWPQDSGIAVLLVAAHSALEGAGSIKGLPVRGGDIQVYFLRAMDEIEDAGLAAFVEDLGLAFPRH